MDRLRGIVAPILTPFDNGGGIAPDLWVAHAKSVLSQGAHYISPFGTTGEATSVSVSERMDALELLINGGVASRSLMPGTGLPALGDTVQLSRHAVELGVAAVMVLPSFFYKNASEDGHYRYFSELVERVASNNLRICLYNIPQNSGVPISPALAARLSTAFPDNIVAFKDSTGNWDNTKATIEAAPGLAVFPGTEALLVKAMQHGGAGCISATVNLNAGAMRAVFDAEIAGADVAEQDRQMNQFRSAVQNADLIPAMKSVLALQSGDARWLNLRAPLLDAKIETAHKLLNELGPLAKHLVKPA